MKILLILAFMCLTAMSTARASLIKYDFSYQFSDTRILAGSFLGTLLSDNDTIEVMQVLDFVTLGGFEMTSLTQVEAYSTFGAGAPGIISISGLRLDIFAFDPLLTNGFFMTDDYSHGSTPVVITAGSPNYNSGDEAFNSNNWSLRATPVSAPFTLAIFALGLMGLASRRFKKQS